MCEWCFQFVHSTIFRCNPAQGYAIRRSNRSLTIWKLEAKRARATGFLFVYLQTNGQLNTRKTRNVFVLAWTWRSVNVKNRPDIITNDFAQRRWQAQSSSGVQLLVECLEYTGALVRFRQAIARLVDVFEKANVVSAIIPTHISFEVRKLTNLDASTFIVKQ